MTAGESTIGLADEAEFAGSLVDVLDDATSPAGSAPAEARAVGPATGPASASGLGPGPTPGLPRGPSGAGEAPLEAARERPAQRPWVGRRLGRFKLLGLLGEGTMGLVIRALDVNLGRIVALKVLRRRIEGMDESQRVAQFLREARAASQVEHPCVTAVYEIGEHRGWWYIASELVEGGSLHALVKSAGPLPVGRACALLADAASALAAAHRLGIVHRDIKPQNLLVSRSGRCKVVDFGLVRLNDPNDPFDFTTRVVGTPLYIAPEVLRRQEGGPPSDVYGLGGTLHFALTGAPPFAGGSAKEIARRHVEAERPDLRARCPECSARLAEIVRRALAIDPAERPTAEELEAALRIQTIGETDLQSTSILTARLDAGVAPERAAGTASGDGGECPGAENPPPGPVADAALSWTALGVRAAAVLGAAVVLTTAGLLLRGAGDRATRNAAAVEASHATADRAAFAARFPDAPLEYAGGALPRPRASAAAGDPEGAPRWSWVGRIDPGGARFVANRHGRCAFPVDSAPAMLLAADNVEFFQDEESVRRAGLAVAPRE